MASNRLKAFLDEHAVKYVSIQHSQAFTAAEVAASAHIAARDFAKTVVVIVNGSPAMVAVPANCHIVLQELRELFEPALVRLASEPELRALFPDCELGAMPPFGNLYGLPVYVVVSLTHEPTIAFNAGTHTEIIQLAYEDFNRLAKPEVIEAVTA